MPVVGYDAQRKKVVAEARYRCNAAKQHRHLNTARSRGEGEVTATNLRSGISYRLPYAG